MTIRFLSVATTGALTCALLILPVSGCGKKDKASHEHKGSPANALSTTNTESPGSLSLTAQTPDRDSDRDLVPFPVTFGKHETHDNREYLINFIKALAIMGSPSLRNPSVNPSGPRRDQLIETFDGFPPRMREVVQDILKRQPGCSSKGWNESIAEKIEYLMDERYKRRVGSVNPDPYSEAKRHAPPEMHKTLDALRKTDQNERQRAQALQDETHAMNEKQLWESLTSFYKLDPSCVLLAKELVDLVEPTTDAALATRSQYLQQVSAQQQRVAERKRAQQIALQRHEAEQFQKYAHAIKSGKQPLKSIGDAKIYYEPIDGYPLYVANPPMRMPDDKRNLYLLGFVEDAHGGTVICSSDGNGSDRWCFETGNLKSYLPRKGEQVQAIGRLSGLMQGKTLRGHVYMIVIKPAALETGDGKFFHQ